jgi:hypothetical protein
VFSVFNLQKNILYNIWKGSMEFEDDEDEGILILQGEKR